MDVSVSGKARKVVASAWTDSSGDSTILTFTEDETNSSPGNEINIYLPGRMSACATMIAEAFNAHMRSDAATVYAQSGKVSAATLEAFRAGMATDGGSLIVPGSTDNVRTFPTGGARSVEDVIAAGVVEGDGPREPEFPV